MRERMRLIHSPMLGINFHEASSLSLVSVWVLFSYLISLSLNSFRMIESPLIFVTKNITRSTFAFNFSSNSMKLTSIFFFTSVSAFSFSSLLPHKISVFVATSLIDSLRCVIQLLMPCIFQWEMPPPPPSPGRAGLEPKSSIRSSRSSFNFYTCFLTSPMFYFNTPSTLLIFLEFQSCNLLIFPLIQSMDELARFCSAFDFLILLQMLLFQHFGGFIGHI